MDIKTNAELQRTCLENTCTPAPWVLLYIICMVYCAAILYCRTLNADNLKFFLFVSNSCLG